MCFQFLSVIFFFSVLSFVLIWDLRGCVESKNMDVAQDGTLNKRYLHNFYNWRFERNWIQSEHLSSSKALFKIFKKIIFCSLSVHCSPRLILSARAKLPMSTDGLRWITMDYGIMLSCRCCRCCRCSRCLLILYLLYSLGTDILF